MVDVRMIEQFTHDSVDAYALRHHLRKGAGSHFYPEVPDLSRLAALGESLGAVFTEAALAEPRDPEKLAKALIEHATLALMWVEVLDKYHRCNCIDVTPLGTEEKVLIPGPEACPLHKVSDDSSSDS